MRVCARDLVLVVPQRGLRREGCAPPLPMCPRRPPVLRLTAALHHCCTVHAACVCRACIGHHNNRKQHGPPTYLHDVQRPLVDVQGVGVLLQPRGGGRWGPGEGCVCVSSGRHGGAHIRGGGGGHGTRAAGTGRRAVQGGGADQLTVSSWARRTRTIRDAAVLGRFVPPPPPPPHTCASLHHPCHT